MPQSDLAQQLQIMRRERDAVRSTNSSLQTELEKYREQVTALQSHGSSLHSQFSVSETTKSVTNKVGFHRFTWLTMQAHRGYGASILQHTYCLQNMIGMPRQEAMVEWDHHYIPQ